MTKFDFDVRAGFERRFSVEAGEDQNEWMNNG